jgi:uncharacterized protein (TIGR02246 family)
LAAAPRGHARNTGGMKMITTLRNTAIAAVSFIALAGCAQNAPPAADTAADEAAIHAVGSAWGNAYNAANAEALVALYAEDALVSPPGVPALRGHDAIREYFTKDVAASAEGGYGIKINPGEVGIAGDVAWASGTWTVSDKSGTAVDTGKDVTVYRKKHGKWLLIRDIWNSDAPPPPPEPAAATS